MLAPHAERQDPSPPGTPNVVVCEGKGEGMVAGSLHALTHRSPARLLCRCFTGIKGKALRRASSPLKTKASQEENPFPTLPSTQPGKAGLLVKAGAFPGANWCF